jgi:hypothetical protein
MRTIKPGDLAKTPLGQAVIKKQNWLKATRPPPSPTSQSEAINHVIGMRKKFGLKTDALEGILRNPHSMAGLSARLDDIIEFKNKSGIHINPKNKGKFTATKKKTGKSTEELTHSSNALTKKRAVFAENAKKWAKNRKKKNMSDASDAIEFAGGYVNTGIGVRKEKGVGGHFNRNAGKYVGGTVGSIPGLGIGALIDHLRKKKSVLKTSAENKVSPELAKGDVYSYSEISDRLDRIINFADPRPRNPLGEFTGQEEGPNPNDMAKVYQTGNRTGIAEGAGATAAGAASLPLVAALLKRARKAK